MFQSNTMPAFNYYINVFVFIAASCIAILGLLFVKSHQSFDRYTALPAHSLPKDSFLASFLELLRFADHERSMISLGAVASALGAIVFMVM
jgi:hypothetical protein